MVKIFAELLDGSNFKCRLRKMAKEFGQLRHDFLPDCLVSLDERLPACDAGRRIVGEIAGELLQAALKARSRRAMRSISFLMR